MACHVVQTELQLLQAWYSTHACHVPGASTGQVQAVQPVQHCSPWCSPAAASSLPMAHACMHFSCIFSDAPAPDVNHVRALGCLLPMGGPRGRRWQGGMSKGRVQAQVQHCMGTSTALVQAQVQAQVQAEHEGKYRQVQQVQPPLWPAHCYWRHRTAARCWAPPAPRLLLATAPAAADATAATGVAIC